jgi:hypothetical protein
VRAYVQRHTAVVAFGWLGCQPARNCRQDDVHDSFASRVGDRAHDHLADLAATVAVEDIGECIEIGAVLDDQFRASRSREDADDVARVGMVERQCLPTAPGPLLERHINRANEIAQPTSGLGALPVGHPQDLVEAHLR